MTVGRSGWTALGVFLLGFWLLMQVRAGDFILNAFIWTAILLALTHQAVNAFRGDPHTTDLTAGLPASWRRWIFGESSVLSARLRSSLDSATMQVGDQVDAVLLEDVTQDDVELIPAGSLLHGAVAGVVRASEKDPLGRLSIAFAVVQHASMRSRAGIKTQPVVFEAQASPDAGASRRRKQQPVDVTIPAGQHLSLILSDPLLVFIPSSPPPRPTPEHGRNSRP